jgi:D-alanyl-D-alanine carboxypeptidase
MRRRIFIAIGLLVLIAGLGAGYWFVSRHNDSLAQGQQHVSKANQNTTTSAQPAAQPSTPAFNKAQFPLDTASSPWVIVNKQRPLSPLTYAPQLIVPNIPLRLSASVSEMHVSVTMTPALEKLVAAAKNEGIRLMLASGYRSYQEQITVYNNEVKRGGQAAADRVSARPGHSEHQTGLAADLEPASRKCEVEACFGDMAEGKWLAAHAYEYGFVIRYPNGSEPTTGYSYEPWHIRYVGDELAQELQKQGNPLLEDYFGLGAAPNYAD